MSETTRVLRVFISSPGDVAEERLLARSAIDQLMYDPFLRGRVSFEVIAWDVGRIAVPMLATQTPQLSVNDAIPRPSECDIVIVILWGRMGTPIPASAFVRADGSPYASGTEWEFEDAVGAARQTGQPVVLVYRRRSPVVYDLGAPDAAERADQLASVEAFFGRMVDDSTGSMLSGVNEYSSPDAFRKLLEAHLRELVFRLVGPGGDGDADRLEPELWSGSPFPGLRSFTSVDEPIFFGRGQQTDELVDRIARESFVAVVGASGSGKSSLVGAGLIPRLAAGAVEGSDRWWLPVFEPRLNQWTGLFFTPAEMGPDPFLVLAQRLAPGTSTSVRSLAERLRAEPDAVSALVRDRAAALGSAALALMVVDQFEELFTLVDERYRQPFIEALAALSSAGTARVVITVRSDFYPSCLEIPGLARLLMQGHLPLAAPTDELLDMIVRPAARAGLEFDPGLPARILADAGRTSGSLPLLAYTLDELYRLRDDSGRLTAGAYDRLGGVSGAIGARAHEAFSALTADVRDTFRDVFSRLVDVAEGGNFTRRRCELDRAAHSPAERALVDALTDARLLEVSGGEDGRPVVSVAHEALFSSWPLLAEWLESIRADLQLIRRVNIAAAEWQASGRDESYLWQQERLDAVVRARAALHPVFDAVVEEFLQPEHLRLLARLEDESTMAHARQTVADRLVELSPASIPGLVRCMSSPSPEVRGVASSALARIGTPAASSVEPLLRHADAEVRLAAVGAIGRSKPVDSSALLPLLADGDSRVRSVAAGILEGTEGRDRVEVLLQLAAGDADERWRAAGKLGTLGVEGVGPLVGLAVDPSRLVQRSARLAVQALGRAAVPPLIAELRGGEAPRRAAAADLLAAIGPDAIPDLLVAAADSSIRQDIRLALATMGHEAVPALLEAASGSAPAREVAVAALLDIGSMAAVFGLVERGLLTSDAITA